MVKGIINAFDLMKFCLVRNLTTTGLAGKRTVFVHRILVSCMSVLLLAFIPGSKYLLRAKKVNF